MEHYDVLVFGGGAAGLMCALTAGRRGRRVLVVEHANKVGKKILMSGGGRCNFTNTGTSPDNFLSANLHFCKSALARYTPWHFIEMVERHGIAYHEKELGQLFCDVSSKLIVKMMLDECADAAGRLDPHPGVRALVQQHLHDQLGRHVAEQLAQLLLVVRDVVALDHLDEVPRGVPGEGGLAEVRVGRQEVVGRSAGIGEVAAAAA